jgi:DNA-binding NtrC family response regulator
MKNKVLIVDDDDSILNTVDRILSQQGIAVKKVNSGQACLKALEEGFKGLILMDVIMPGMDGWDTVKSIVDRGYLDGVLICMLTGKSDPDQKMETLKEYILDYIRKPFDYKTFIELVKEYLSYLK